MIDAKTILPTFLKDELHLPRFIEQHVPPHFINTPSQTGLRQVDNECAYRVRTASFPQLGNVNDLEKHRHGSCDNNDSQDALQQTETRRKGQQKQQNKKARNRSPI